MCRPVLIFLAAVTLAACSPRINVIPDYSEPLRESTLAGDGNDRILLLPVSGMIQDTPRRGLLLSRPSVVEETVSVLRAARRDDRIKAVVLLVHSPGGMMTACDIIYDELTRFKAERRVPIVALLTNVAASGGYYIALAGDRIVAQRSTLTGSIGVIWYNLGLSGLMGKLGVEVSPVKAGRLKDMGSPFRDMTAEEQAVLQTAIDEMYDMFVDLVAQRRPSLPAGKARELADGRIYTASQALAHGLIDRVGTFHDAVDEATRLAGISQHRVVVYRRQERADDTPYNLSAGALSGGQALIDLGRAGTALDMAPGIYMLWEPGVDN